MKCRIFPLALSAILSFFKFTAHAEFPEFLKDLNEIPVSVTEDFNPVIMIDGDIGIFVGRDKQHGAEIWRTDGTAAGTFRLSDIVPGAGTGDPFDLTVGPGADSVLFVATRPDGIRALFQTDGSSVTQIGSITTTQGLFGVTNILDVIGSTIYFGGEGDLNAASTGKGVELWRVISGNNPVFIEDINPGAASSSPSRLGVLGTKLVFRASTAAEGIEPWVSEGSAATTSLLDDVRPGALDSSPTALGLQGGYIILSMSDAGSDFELWRTDGTAGGTDQIEDINPGSNGSFPQLVADLAGALYFSAGTGIVGSNRELYRTNGNSVVFVKDIYPGDKSSSPGRGVEVGSKVYFIADSLGLGRELWVTDGSAANTELVIDLVPGQGGQLVGPPMISYGGKVFFQGTDSTAGTELWVHEPGINTKLLRDFNPGSKNSNPKAFFTAAGRLFFFGLDGSAGPSLYSSDGTSAGTILITTLFDSTANESSFPSSFVDMGNGRACFKINREDTTNDLACSDGTSIGTTTVRNFFSLSGSNISLASLGDSRVLLAAEDLSTGKGRELWLSDGTDAGTTLLKDIFPGTGDSSPGAFTQFGSKIIFVAADQTDNRELWITDLTEAGTKKVIDLGGGSFSGIGASFSSVVLNGKLIFPAQSSVGNNELWITDGTEVGTSQILEINATGSANPFKLTSFNGAAYFTADDGVHGREIWRTDGTAAGTSMVVDLYPGAFGAGADNLLLVGNTLFFFANTPETGTELYKSDGTQAGTALVKDIKPGSGSSNPLTLASVGNLVHFYANDGVVGFAPWRSDGTDAGTFLLKDINTVSDTSSFTTPQAYGGFVYFPFFDGANNQLWRSDGTTGGTIKVSNFPADPDQPNFAISSITVSAGHLFIDANTASSGFELYAINDLCLNDTAKFTPGTCGCGVADVDANANGLVDCLAAGELKKRVQAAIALLQKVKAGKSKKIKKIKADLKAALDSIAAFVTSDGSTVVLTNASANLSALASAARKAVLKASKAKAKKIKKHKKTAAKALNDLLGVLG